jgi:hypothetical protein
LLSHHLIPVSGLPEQKKCPLLQAGRKRKNIPFLNCKVYEDQGEERSISIKIEKPKNQGWLSKKLRIRGAQIFNHFDVQEVLRND